jgi:hypothetical protein
VSKPGATLCAHRQSLQVCRRKLKVPRRNPQPLIPNRSSANGSIPGETATKESGHELLGNELLKNEHFKKVFQNELAARDATAPRRAGARAIREATMDKVDELLFSSAEHSYPSAAIGRIYSDSNLHLKDRRVAQLLVILRLLHQSPGGLRAVPMPELHEIVTCAVRLSDFVNPAEARTVVATVLEALEAPDPRQESP